MSARRSRWRRGSTSWIVGRLCWMSPTGRLQKTAELPCDVRPSSNFKPDLRKLTPLVSQRSVDAFLTELGELPGDRAQIGQHRRIHGLDRPRDDVAALGHVDAAGVGVGGLEALVAVDRQ